MSSAEQHFFFSSESVTEGHPDKLCDALSDTILDACLKDDPKSKVAIESVAKSNTVMIAGEVTTASNINIEQLVRDRIKEIGYDAAEKGIDYQTCDIIQKVTKQSPDIAQSVHENKKEEDNNEQSGKSVESDVKSDRDYLSRIYEEYIPGTNEFFSAVANDAKKAVEESLGEEFDQFNPEHMARYNYFAAKSAKEREEEMKRGIEQCKRQDEEERQARIRAEQQAAYNNAAKKFNDYMGTQIKTQELADRFKEFVDTSLSNRDQPYWSWVHSRCHARNRTAHSPWRIESG